MGNKTGNPPVGNHEWDATDQARERTRNQAAHTPSPTDAQTIADLRAKLNDSRLTGAERATIEAQIKTLEGTQPKGPTAPSDVARLAELRAELEAGGCTPAECNTINAEITAIEARQAKQPK